MAQNNLMMYAMLGIGGYLLYRNWDTLMAAASPAPAPSNSGGSGQPVIINTGGQAAGTTSGQTQTPTNTTQNSGTNTQQTQSPTPPPPTVNTTDKLILIKAAMSAAGENPETNNSPDVYNYYYAQLYGPAPTPEAIGLDHSPTTIYAWWGHMQNHGLGLIVHGRNPYRNPTGRPFGSNISPNGSERLIVRYQ